MFKPTYEIKYYKLGFYPFTYLTEMKYNSLKGEQLLYIYGKYENESYPEKDFVVYKRFWDGASAINAVCDSIHNITLFIGDGNFEQPVPSTKMSIRHADSYSEYREQPGMIIKAIYRD